MSIEYLLVTFAEERAVLADDARVGFTNRTFMLPTGEYAVTLEGDGYQPQSLDVAIAGTSLVKPMVIAFALPASAATPAAPSPPAARVSARKGKRRRTNG